VDRGYKKGEVVMISHRTTAVIMGALFIVAALLIGVFLGSTLEAPDYLTNVAANDTRVVIAVIFELILAVSVFGIGFALFPVLRRHTESLALGYVGLRIIARAFHIVGTIILLLFLPLSREFVKAGAPDPSRFQTLGGLLRA
jgi:uncharacterized protein YacL